MIPGLCPSYLMVANGGNFLAASPVSPLTAYCHCHTGMLWFSLSKRIDIRI